MIGIGSILMVGGFEPPPPLGPTAEIDNISPAAVSSITPVTLVVTGLHFTGATQVTEGPFNVPATSFTVDSDTQITANFAANGDVTDNNAQFATVSVTTPAGVGGFESEHFTWVGAYDCFPSTGSAYGGGTIEIDGVGFTGAISASLNGVDCPDFTVVNNGIIRFTLPAGTTLGPVPLNVYFTDTTLNFEWDTAFSYTIPIVITGISPPSGAETGSFTLTGVGFSHATDVTGNGFTLGTWAIVDDNTITATHDPEGPSPPYTGTIGVHDGTYDAYTTYQVGAVITAVSISSGTVHGGDAMTITGVGFTAATDVTFLGSHLVGASAISAVSVVVVSETEITLTTPDWSVGIGHASGPAHISIVLPYGTFDDSAAFFTYTP